LVIGAAHNLEAHLAGAAVVGNNLAAALEGARSDAIYAQMLFLFLGLPGAVLAALLTAALASAGADRRRAEQALLRTRGLAPRKVARLAVVEALLVGTAGGILGLGIGAAAGRLAFGPSPAGSSTSTTLIWAAIAFTAGLAIATLTVLVPALRDLRTRTVAQASHAVGRARTPWWMKSGVDFLLTNSRPRLPAPERVRAWVKKCALAPAAAACPNPAPISRLRYRRRLPAHTCGRPEVAVGCLEADPAMLAGPVACSASDAVTGLTP
jgi:hypothetical protein